MREEDLHSRRDFLRKCGSTFAGTSATLSALHSPENVAASFILPAQPFCIDTHMHVWSGNPAVFPFAHPNDPDFSPPPVAATVEILLEEMNQNAISHCVLVQTIYHGWDNRYLAHCLKLYPDRFRGHGLIDPQDPDVAAKLEYGILEQGLAGMRFSPIYYQQNDDWMTSPAIHRMWQKAEELGAILNFFISTQQLPKLESMISRFPGVSVVIDHLARIDLKAADPLPEFRKLLALAKYPGVRVKVSELSVLSVSAKYPWADTFPWVRLMYDAFGPDRMLWGTGFPGATRGQAGRPALNEELDLIRHEIPFFTPEDRAAILGGNAARLWKFSPLSD